MDTSVRDGRTRLVFTIVCRLLQALRNYFLHNVLGPSKGMVKKIRHLEVVCQ